MPEIHYKLRRVAGCALLIGLGALNYCKGYVPAEHNMDIGMTVSQSEESINKEFYDTLLSPKALLDPLTLAGRCVSYAKKAIKDNSGKE